MSKPDDLIAEFCPNGVESIELREISHMKRGTSITRNDIIDGEIPVISGGREPAYYCNKYNRDNETITIAGSGAGAGYVQYWTRPIFVCDAFSIKGKDNILTKYIFYYLSNLQEEIYNTKKGGGVPHVHVSSIERFKIPLPPIEAQREIVKILDNFTELTARKKQYEYYRDTLLTFDDSVECKSLGEVAIYSKDRLSANLINSKNYVGVENLLQNKQGKTSAVSLPKQGNVCGFSCDDVLIRNIRPYLKKIWFANISGGTNGDVLVVRSKNKKVLLPKYIHIVLSADKFFEYNMQNAKGAKMPRGDKDSILKYKFKLPPLAEQQRIVDILDRFDSLCNDITQGLPAEIEARKKQYEYYRDKLLTFKELKLEV